MTARIKHVTDDLFRVVCDVCRYYGRACAVRAELEREMWAHKCPEKETP